MSNQEVLTSHIADNRYALHEISRRLTAIERALAGNGDAGALPELLSIRTTCRILGGISRSTLYRMIHGGQLESVRVGGRRMVTARSVRWHLPSALTRGS